MLTTKALEERKWGRFPALRKALDNKPFPGDCYGITSISDNLGNQIVRSLEIATLAREHAAAVRETAQAVGSERMKRDLQTLEEELRWASSQVEREIEEIQRLHAII